MFSRNFAAGFALSRPLSTTGLPDSDGVDGVDQHDDVEGEVVAYDVGKREFDEHDSCDSSTARQAGSEGKPEDACNCVG